MNQDEMEEGQPAWDLNEWEDALTLRVGATYVCRACGNVVMVSKGGIGVLDIVCCGKPMEQARARGTEGGR